MLFSNTRPDFLGAKLFLVGFALSICVGARAQGVALDAPMNAVEQSKKGAVECSDCEEEDTDLGLLDSKSKDRSRPEYAGFDGHAGNPGSGGGAGPGPALPGGNGGIATPSAPAAPIAAPAAPAAPAEPPPLAAPVAGLP